MNSYFCEYFTDGRRPYRQTDFALLPPGRQRRFATIQDAAESMHDCPIAFQVSSFDGGPYSVGVLAEYVLAQRARKGAPWRKTGKTALASCQAQADEALGNPDGALVAAFCSDDFWRIEAKQHLQALKINRR